MPTELAKAEPPKWEHHGYALDVSGYTHLPDQVAQAELVLLRECADRALAAARATLLASDKDRHDHPVYYQSARCMYVWGEACVRLLEHDTIHALSALMIGDYQLWDTAVLASMPSPPSARQQTVQWHRDFAGPHWGTEVLSYLWFFICLDDLTPDNGATWVVPGSHRVRSRHERPLDEVWDEAVLPQHPSRHQLCARAGDILVLNPTMIHSPGQNATDQPRRILFIGTCHTAAQPLFDHWRIAGPRIQAHASPRVRHMLQGNRKPLPGSYEVLPEGWQTGEESLSEPG